MALFSFFLATLLTIPGIFGNLVSLILLNIKKNDDMYDGIIHYYGLIFSMDLIVVLISTFDEWDIQGLNALFDLKLWSPENPLYCKLAA